MYTKQNKKDDAIKILQGVLKTSPGDSVASGSIKTLTDTLKMKPVK